MPELPEVEVTRRAVAPLVTGQAIVGVRVRERRLRWPVSQCLARELTGQPIEAVERRGKYLLFRAPAGTLIMHLGMSGSLRVVNSQIPPQAHDHLDLELEDGRCLRLRDPRRFGAALWTRRDPYAHRLLAGLGPEPLSDTLTGELLYERSRSRKVAIKAFLMNASVVVGIGNIYANEALFEAGIHPGRAAGRIALKRYTRLTGAIRRVLTEAIAAGGTTLRDFQSAEGRPGYFARYLRSYGRADEPCPRCTEPIRLVQQGQRATYYCVRCQR